METLELPVTRELEETPAAPVNFVEQDVDLAAFKLWRDASCLYSTGDGEK